MRLVHGAEIDVLNIVIFLLLPASIFFILPNRDDTDSVSLAVTPFAFKFVTPTFLAAVIVLLSDVILSLSDAMSLT